MPAKSGEIARGVDYEARRPYLVHCETDGVIDVKFKHSAALEPITMIEGTDRMFDHPLPLTVTIKSGTFSFA